MIRRTVLTGAVAAVTLLSALPLAADTDTIAVVDPYARVSTSMSKSGAIFLVLDNHGAEDDRLLSAASPVAERAELHTHLESGDGIMKMVEIEGGIAIPAGGHHMLKRGGDHVMLLGLTRSLAQGDQFPLTLTFEQAGEITVDVPVDLERKPMSGHADHMQHGKMAN